MAMVKADFVASDEEDGTVTVLKQSSSTRGYDPPLVITAWRRPPVR